MEINQFKASDALYERLMFNDTYEMIFDLCRKIQTELCLHDDVKLNRFLSTLQLGWA